MLPLPVALLLTARLQAAEPPAMPAEEAAPVWVSARAPEDLFKLYGFINGYWEKVGPTPVVDSAGATAYEENPQEFDVLNLNVMAQGAVARHYRYFFNLAAPGAGSPTEDAPVVLRNAWVEAALVGDALSLRLGKTYRRFGLYNEILDATPTFIGIEPPEMFDKDHLLLTRTTNLMVHGRFSPGELTVNWALMTGNDERESSQVPLGADLNLVVRSALTVGSSFYTSGGSAAPSHGVGGGPPDGGVAPWMEIDEYWVSGGYVQVKARGFQLQAEGWSAQHHGERDPAAVAELAAAGLTGAQISRFGLQSGELNDVSVLADYSVRTGYVRVGQSFRSRFGRLADAIELTTYAQLDHYRNPESIGDKAAGGDGEAGLSDDGIFTKPTLGVMLRPVPAVALKVDGSGHIQKFNGQTEIYPELRVSVSYNWQMTGSGR
jgi:hypothetical protein